MKTMIKVLPVCALALFMVACGGGKKNYQHLTARQWVLDKVEYADSSSQIVIPANLTISFADSNKMVYGRGPCNGFFGPFKAEGDSLSFGNLASTMAYCLNMTFESAYHIWLSRVKTFHATENTLTLRDANNKLTMYYIIK